MPEPMGNAGCAKSIAKNFERTHSLLGPEILSAVRPWERSVTVPIADVTRFSNFVAIPSA